MIAQAIIWIFVGLINGLKDRSALNRFKKAYWNKGGSWKRKWKTTSMQVRIKETERKWYYLWKFTPKYKEAFPLSSTFLVSLTDGWHLLKFIQFRLIVLSVALLGSYNIPVLMVSMFTLPAISISGIIFYVGILTCFGIGFWITYESKEKRL